MKSVSIKASNPLVNSSGSARAEPVSQLDVDVLESPSEEAISQEGWQVRVEKRSLPAHING
jgi:ribosomal protein S10